MEFTISKSALQKELGFVQGIVERKNSIPALTHILIETEGEGQLRITATDLDVTVRCRTEANIITPGQACVQARKFFDIVKLLPDDVMRFRTEDNDRSTVSCQNFMSKIMGIARSSFPDIPQFKETSRLMTASAPTEIIDATIFAITQEESRYTLSGAKFLFDQKGALMVTTDGHRLSYILAPLNGDNRNNDAKAIDVLIPKKTLTELRKLASEYEGNVPVGADDNHIYFQVGARELITRKLVGQFPNYEMVIPTTYTSRAVFEVKLLTKALKRVALMSEERSKGVRIEIVAGQMRIDASNSEDGEASETIPIDYVGEEVAIGFNASYLQDFLDSVDEEKMIMEFKDASSQALLFPQVAAPTSDRKMILMPLRI